MPALVPMSWCPQVMSRGCWREHASQGNRFWACTADAQGCWKQHASSGEQGVTVQSWHLGLLEGEC